VAAKGGRDADAAAVRAVHAARGAAAGRRGRRDRRAGRRQRPPTGLRGTAVRGNCVTSLPCLARSAHTAFEAADADTGCVLMQHGFFAGGVCYARHAWFVCGSSITEPPALTPTGGQPFSQCQGVRCAQTAAGTSIPFFTSAVEPCIDTCKQPDTMHCMRHDACRQTTAGEHTAEHSPSLSCTAKRMSRP